MFDVESSTPVLSNQVSGGRVTFVRWTTCANSLPYKKFKDSEESVQNDTWDFLIQFPSLSKAFSYNPSTQEDIQACHKLSAESSPSILLVGTEAGQVSFFFSGYLAMGKIQMDQVFELEERQPVKEILLSPSNLSTLSVISATSDVEKSSSQFSMFFIQCPLLASCFSELCTLSSKQSILQGTMDYMSDTLKQISEGWESILSEMDNKLQHLASHMPDQHGMSADFLELLMLGIPSAELEHFLIQDLGEKGLKKLGHSIDVSYSNMQRLVLKYLHTVSQALNFHLAEMKGQIQASDKYEAVLKVSVEAVSEAQQNAAVLWAKAVELQQVIDESMKCFKAFFKWLYVEILRLSEENVSEELSKTSQQDVQFIADFLASFSTVSSPDSYSYLEKVGQYLKNEPLVQPIDRSRNPWYQFLKENPNVANIPEIIQVDEKASLVQTYQRLEDSIKAMFTALDSDFSQICVPQRMVTVNSSHWDFSSRQDVVGQMEFDDKEDRINAFIMTKTLETPFSFLFLSWNPVNHTLNGLQITGGNYVGSGYSIVTQSFYTHDVVSVLLSSEGVPRRLIQLPISQMEPYMATLTTSMINLQDTQSFPKQSIFSLASAVSVSSRKRIFLLLSQYTYYRLVIIENWKV